MVDRTLCFLIKGDPPDQILLGFKKVGFGAGKYTGIGGKIEAGETIIQAAIRELEEETSVRTTANDLQPLGQLTFLFPASPAWSQVVHIFRTATWEGNPEESVEMRSMWFDVNQLPFEQMWQDARYWLPSILSGEPVQMRFVFEDDNKSIKEFQNERI